MPLLWIVLTPVLTGPVTWALVGAIISSHACRTLSESYIGGTASCPQGWLIFALSPGLLNLAPFVWLIRGDPRSRPAAVVASLLGVARIAVPIAGVLISEEVLYGIFQFPNDELIAVVDISGVLWVISLVAWLGFLAAGVIEARAKSARDRASALR